MVKVKGKGEWRWGGKDGKTGYKISGPLTRRRSYNKGTKPLLHKIKHNCKGLPKKIITDKLGLERDSTN
ncbi:MAG: hypothetical protein ACE5KV_06345, partial [Thermoplasmata archaeon]